MKRLISITSCLLLTSLCTVAYADDARLQIKVSGTAKNNTYFLCVDGVGCVSMFAADHGKTYPLTPGQIERIYMINRTNLRTYFQPLPESCNVTINSNQTLTVRGKLVNRANNDTRIENLECKVA